MNTLTLVSVAMMLVSGVLLAAVLSAAATWYVLCVYVPRRRAVARAAAERAAAALCHLEALALAPQSGLNGQPDLITVASCLALTPAEVSRCACNTDFVELVADAAVTQANERALNAALDAAVAGTTDLSRAAVKKYAQPLPAPVAIFALCGRWPRLRGKRQAAGRG